MKIAFISSDPSKHISSRLTRFWTGSTCFHVAFIDEPAGRMYDMNLLRRKRLWPYYGDNAQIVLVESPVEIGAPYLEGKLLTDETHYGFMDYCLFALRPLYHLFGKSTRNMGGVICSEMIYNDLVANGWPVTFDEVPSPADIEDALVRHKLSKE